MLPRVHRLTRNRDVERVSRRGRPVFARSFTMRVARNALEETRVTVVAGLKVSKRAVRRNRVKRLLREALRKYLPKVAGGYDIVVHAKPESLGKTHQELTGEVGWALTKARVFTEATGEQTPHLGRPTSA